ncbi:hypothetical protein OG799_32105 [Micromonospora sp. NBC_00898]|uniref:hypothetical protein n=1 Tax=Micromonospora sp. NBC_00898 TaxID=2975981 RepID=UPI00386E4A4A|nr:hypothetical protein OG799_32105 [Micromonospora sp. NBC_00898]
MTVETTGEKLLPDVVKLPQTGIYVGASDVPVPAVEHLYVRVDGPVDEVIYGYRGSRSGL